jgi:hypothetical protein
MIVLKTADVQVTEEIMFTISCCFTHNQKHTHTERIITMHVSAEIPSKVLTDVTVPLGTFRKKQQAL